MEVRTLPTAEEFLAATQALRSRDPVMTNLVGSVATAVASGAPYDHELWLVVVDGGEVVGCVGRTAPWPAVLSPMAPGAARELGRHLAAEAPDVDALTGPRATADAVAAGMGRAATVRLRDVVRVLSALGPPPDCPGRARRAGADDLALVVAWFAAFAVEAGMPVPSNPDLVRANVEDERVWLWEDLAGEVVALAGHARVVASPTGTVGRVGPVYTAPPHRRRGYGSAVTHAVTATLAGACDRVMLFADAENPGSNRVYQRLGFEEVGEIVELELSEPA
jgi:ribosomal protein S18 acetylase RimI-like enzyme